MYLCLVRMPAGHRSTGKDASVPLSLSWMLPSFYLVFESPLVHRGADVDVDLPRLASGC